MGTLTFLVKLWKDRFLLRLCSNGFSLLPILSIKCLPSFPWEYS
uniref:Uncharacterized protein n=1 Tax=Leptospira santarosai serovar Arenal str. MAVJ 401 TaxID=1049976 RepID=M6JRM6_9LEPT|nr:hypothetical protein LEP1GSC063_0157 [Leptospira santarosai serovar Arenal str. MAVJ 401]